MHVRDFFWRHLKRPKLWHLLKIPSALAILCIRFCSWTTPNQNSHCLPRLITSTCTLRVLYVVPALISVISNFMQLTCEMEVPVYIRPASSDNGVRKRGSHFFFFFLLFIPNIVFIHTKSPTKKSNHLTNTVSIGSHKADECFFILPPQ